MIPESGIGIVYMPGLENLIESFSERLDTIEVEPQTTWYRRTPEDDSFRFDNTVTEWLKQTGKPIIFHGVGFPVGGTVKAGQNHFDTLKKQAAILNPLYISEHLSFNKYHGPSSEALQVNFLLPPLQNAKGINAATENILHYKKQTGLPFAFETGTNYLNPVQHEYPDGYFINEVARRSDSYILLDIHNLLANELNGRQKIKDLVQMLDKERVIEIHLAGGHYYKNYYLDAHSAITGDELFSIAGQIIKQLPNLKSIIFEMLPEYYGRTINDREIQLQVDRMRKLWDMRGKNGPKKQTHFLKFTPGQEPAISVSEWENTLGQLVCSKPVDTDLGRQLIQDSGLEIIRDLVFEFRASAVVSALKITCRYIKLAGGRDMLRDLLEEFCRRYPPEIFGFANGKRFADFIKSKKPDLQYLQEIVNFEIAAMASAFDGKNRIIELPFEPYRLLDALVNNLLPDWGPHTDTVYETELTGNETDADALLRIESVYHQ